MNQPIIKILLFAVMVLAHDLTSAQCNNNPFTISANPICGNEEVTFSVDNPNPNLSYFWNFGQGGGVSADGPSVTHTYPAKNIDKTYNVTVFNGQGSCVQSITVLSTPDAELTAISGTMPDDYCIAYCLSTSDFPEFDLTVQNTSTTNAINTNYTIDWGDGTPPWTSTTFVTANHVYTAQGQFTLTLTVEGNANCPSSTVEYAIFNSSDPGGSIVNTTNTVTTCYPNTIGYPILGTENNVTGTIYDISISGVMVASYMHPPPDTFYHTFNAPSCGEGQFPFDEDEFVIQMDVISPCQDKLSFVTARLGSPPLAEFTMDPPVICPGQTIVLTNTSEGSASASELCEPILNASWMIEPRTYNIISGDTLNSESLEIEPLEETIYTITMWVDNMCGEDTIVHEAEVGIIPEADAIAALSQSGPCAPTIATFTNLSTQDPSVSYNWQINPPQGAGFVNGTNASSFEPEIRFNGTKIYTVTLTASNDCGAPQWDTVFSIISKPEIDFPPIENLCADTFIYTSNVLIEGDPDQVDWTFNGGTPATFSGLNPPPVIFAGSGSYSITVTAQNSCGDSTFTENFQMSDPVSIDAGTDFMSCFNGPPEILAASPAGGTWSGDGVTGNSFDPTVISADQVTLTYTIDNGICVISDDVVVSIVRIDSLSAGDDETACVNMAPITITGQNPIGGSWFGPGIIDGPAGLFDPATTGVGIHSVGYVYTEPLIGCMDTAFKSVEVLDAPPLLIVAEDTVCLGETALFSTIEISGGNADWNFGNGNVASGFDVEHNFPMEGNFWVSVDVYAGGGCASSDSMMVAVITVPEALFTLDPPNGCNELIVDFENFSTGVIEQMVWDFGNGTNSTDTSPQDIVFQPGTYNDTAYHIQLDVSNQCGMDIYSDSVYVSKNPVALFGTNVNTICPGQELLINNISYNSPDGFFWDFGNGNTSTATNPGSQVYPTPEADTIYTITLISDNQCGVDTIQKEILVKTVNVVSFFNTDPVSGCEPLNVNFINYSTVGSFPIWDFGDGNTSTLDTISHVFTDDGTYTVSLVVDNGCSRDTSEVDINVLPSPAIGFTSPEYGCELTEVVFTNISSNAFGYTWDFGDGNISYDVDPVHSFGIEGEYVVSLTGENQFGCSSSFTDDISIRVKPYADFNADQNNGCAGTEIGFTNLSSNAENYFWDFGDGTISYNEHPVRRYQEDGIYDVTLIANNDNICYDTIVYVGIVEIYPKPSADFDAKQTITGIQLGEVEFSNLSIDAEIYNWDFGDGGSSIDSDPVYRYSSSGQYEVELVSENMNGCLDSITRFIDVDFFGKLFVPNAFSPALGEQSGASVFLPKGVALDQYELEIYSSYGELLWRTEELLDGKPAIGWDGSYNGKLLPQDVYIWKIRAVFDNGLSWDGARIDGVKTTVGTLTLIR